MRWLNLATKTFSKALQQLPSQILIYFSSLPKQKRATNRFLQICWTVKGCGRKCSLGVCNEFVAWNKQTDFYLAIFAKTAKGFSSRNTICVWLSALNYIDNILTVTCLCDRFTCLILTTTQFISHADAKVLFCKYFEHCKYSRRTGKSAASMQISSFNPNSQQ